jgi:hypothetical protein
LKWLTQLHQKVNIKNKKIASGMEWGKKKGIKSPFFIEAPSGLKSPL